MFLVKYLYSGKSCHKVNEIILSISDVKEVKNLNYDCLTYEVFVSVRGLQQPYDMVFELNSVFECFMHGLSFLRQHLRDYVTANTDIKLYEKVYDDELLELNVDEIFVTQDCSPKGLHAAYQWALAHGYKP